MQPGIVLQKLGDIAIYGQESNATTRRLAIMNLAIRGIEDDGEPFEEKMPRLVAELNAQFAESAKPEAAIRANLKSLNFSP